MAPASDRELQFTARGIGDANAVGQRSRQVTTERFGQLASRGDARASQAASVASVATIRCSGSGLRAMRGVILRRWRARRGCQAVPAEAPARASGRNSIEHHSRLRRHRAGAHDHAGLAALDRRVAGAGFAVHRLHPAVQLRHAALRGGDPAPAAAGDRARRPAAGGDQDPAGRAGPPQRDGDAAGRAAGADAAPGRAGRAPRAARRPEAAGHAGAAAGHGARPRRRRVRRCRRGSSRSTSSPSSLQKLSRQVDERADQLGVLEALLVQDSANRKFLPTLLPIVDGWYSSNFGYRIDPFTGSAVVPRGHRLSRPTRARRSSPPRAARSIEAGVHPQYGKIIEIDHGNGLVSRYAHASQGPGPGRRPGRARPADRRRGIDRPFDRPAPALRGPAERRPAESCAVPAILELKAGATRRWSRRQQG